MRHSRFILPLLVLLIGGIALALYLRTPKPPESAGVPETGKTAPLEGKSEAPRDVRQGSDRSTEVAKSAQTEPETPERPPVQHFGKAVPVKASASPQAAAVSEALRTKQHPERLSALIAPKPFDQAAFEANPDAYLRSVEPGRVFQCAQPGKDVPVLAVQGPSMSRIKQGASVKLAVKGAPHAPVSFTAFDMGEFSESKLNCVTVQADQQGVAVVTFVATPGALNDCTILAGSPMASGAAKFLVVVEEAAQAAP